MPYGIGRLMRLRGGSGRGLAGFGCTGHRIPFGRGLIGTATSILAGLALNDLADPQGFMRSAARRLVQMRLPVKVIGFEPAGQNQESGRGGLNAPKNIKKEE
jgi:hypothetical protein